MTNDEKGYIKFECEWIKNKALPKKKILELNKVRDELYSLKLVGAYKNGIGYGNISQRVGKTEEFIITGSATGNFDKIDEKSYATVKSFDIDKNSLTCKGPIKASSESMTHGAVYISCPKMNAVIHVHSLKLWKKLLNKVPTTNKKAEYGSPEIANEIIRLLKKKETKEKKIITLAGHKEGIITFGKDLDEARKVLLKQIK